VVLGARHLPDPLGAGARPLLFVGNHTRFGLYDLPLLVRPLPCQDHQLIQTDIATAAWVMPLVSLTPAARFSIRILRHLATEAARCPAAILHAADHRAVCAGYQRARAG
jgi:hypothetical protein